MKKRNLKSRYEKHLRNLLDCLQINKILKKMKNKSKQNLISFLLINRISIIDQEVHKATHIPRTLLNILTGLEMKIKVILRAITKRTKRKIN